MSGEGVRPGWYPDPWAPAGLRWWDGQTWTARAAAPQWSGGKPSSKLVADELAAARWVRWGIRAQAAYTVIAGPIFAVMIREMIDFVSEIGDVQPGEPVQITGSVPPVYTLFQLVGLVQWGAMIVFLVWQHRANKASESMGIPLTRSPGWGIGGWFIPIVNFWFPYEAVRDNLPAGDPARPLVIRWWLGLISLGVIVWVVAAVYAVGGAMVGVPLTIASAGYAWWWSSVGVSVVDGVSTTHQRLAASAV